MADSEFVLDIQGLNSVQQQLRKLYKTYGEAAGQALREEAEIEMTEAKRRTPVLTGALRASGHVTGPDGAPGSDISVQLTFGGPAAPYAVEVHENLESYHHNGEAKFLESVILESAPHLAERIAKRIAKG